MRNRTAIGTQTHRKTVGIQQGLPIYQQGKKITFPEELLLKYGTEQRAERLMVFRIVNTCFAPEEQNWPIKMATVSGLS